jgi:hypothetical protein
MWMLATTSMSYLMPVTHESTFLFHRVKTDSFFDFNQQLSWAGRSNRHAIPNSWTARPIKWRENPKVNKEIWESRGISYIRRGFQSYEETILI